MGWKETLSLGVGANLNQGYSTGGSQNSGWSLGNSQSASGTDALSARDWSAQMADLAWQRDMQAYQMQMDFNAEEAQKQRDWQEYMANTIYTRSVKNMREAGINPILAANMGLSGAAVGSGATAAIGGAPSAPLAQNFMDSWSASNSMNQSEQQGSSWNSSENGLVTALTALGSMIGNMLNSVKSASNIQLTLDMLNGNKEAIAKQRKSTNDAVANRDYTSKDYPHNPGSYPANIEGEKDLINKIKNFAQNLFD